MGQQEYMTYPLWDSVTSDQKGQNHSDNASFEGLFAQCYIPSDEFRQLCPLHKQEVIHGIGSAVGYFPQLIAEATPCTRVTLSMFAS